MTERQAISFLRSLASEYGVRDGVQTLATQLQLPWNTVYGWYRRGSIPAWRIDAIKEVARVAREG